MLDEVKFGNRETKEKKNEGLPFLSAHYDPLAGVVTLPQHVILADVHNDGESKLVVGHVNDGISGFKLKLFSQTSLVQSPSLLSLPSAVTSFNIANGVTAIAVGSMNNIFIYKNMKPYFKYTLPNMELNQVEKEAWIQSREDKFDPSMLKDILSTLSAENMSVPLSQRSKAFLKLQNDSKEQLNFLDKYKHQPLSRHSSIVAMTSMSKNIDDQSGLSVLVICTEERELFILDVEAFTVLKRLKLPSVAVFIGSHGIFDVEYHISVISRDGHCYLISRDNNDATDLFPMRTHSVGLIHKGRFLYTANTNATFYSYNLKGQAHFIRNLESTPVCMELMTIRSKGVNLIAIAMENKTISIWNEGDLISTVPVRDIVVAMRFGRYNREDSTLVTVYLDGALEIHIIRRKADFSQKVTQTISKSLENIKMPKMTATYLEEAKYERDNARSIFQRLQYDLAAIKLRSLNELAKIEKKSLSPISSTDPVTMSVTLLGVGPTFKLRVTVTNTSKEVTVTDQYFIFFLYDHSLYRVEQKTPMLPLLIPAQPQVIDTFVRCLSTEGVTGSIRISISKNNQIKPFVSTIINMPPSEMI